MNKATLLVVILLAPMIITIIATTPTASAQAVLTPEEQKEFWEQVQGAGNANGGAVTGSITLTAGVTYYVSAGYGFTGGCSNTAGWRLTDSSNSSTYVELAPNAVVNKRGDVTNIGLMYSANLSQNVLFGTIRFTAPTSATVTLGGFITSCSPSTQGFTALNYPNGVPNAASLLGYVGVYKVGSLEVGAIVKEMSKQGEQGILDSISKTIGAGAAWNDANSQWQRINLATYAPSTSTSSAANYCSGVGAATCEGYQSWTPETSFGQYAERVTAWFQGARSGMSGNMKIAVFASATAPAIPVDLTQARVSAEFSYSLTSGCGCSTQGLLVVNWSRGAVYWESASADSATTGTVTWKEFGVVKTGNDIKPWVAIVPAGQKLWMYVYFTKANDGTFTSPGLGLRTSNDVATGEFCSISGGTWSCTANQDIAGFQVGMYGGTNVVQHVLSATSRNTGGAFWVYTRERLIDSNPQAYTFSSNFGGAARFGSFQFGNATHVIQEWRLGYITPPLTATATYTVDVNTTNAGGNIIESAVFVNQPVASDHFHRQDFGQFTTIALWSTDDFFTQVNVVVKDCLNDDCSEKGNLSVNASYSGKVRGFRSISGNVDPVTAAFNFSGQDISGGDTTLSFTGPGYSKTDWTITVTSPGVISFELGVFRSTGGSGGAVLGSVTITFEGNNTRVVPNAVTIYVNRSRAADLYVDCVRADQSGAVRSACTAAGWSGTDQNAFTFTFPQSVRTTTTSSDAGTYLLFVINNTGTMLGSKPFCIGNTWAEVSSCNVNVGSDLKVQLATDTLNELNAVASNLRSAQVAVTEKTIRERVLYAMDWALGTFGGESCKEAGSAAQKQIGCGIPYIAFWYMGTLMAVGFGIARRGSGGGVQ